MDTEERGYIYMQITMEAVFAVLLAGMGGFIAIPELCESSVGIDELFPIEFTNPCTTHNAKR